MKYQQSIHFKSSNPFAYSKSAVVNAINSLSYRFGLTKIIRKKIQLSKEKAKKKNVKCLIISYKQFS